MGIYTVHVLPKCQRLYLSSVYMCKQSSNFVHFINNFIALAAQVRLPQAGFAYTINEM